jgi:hypothetical protein
MDTELIELPNNAEHVLNRKIDVFGLRPIAERGVKNGDAGLCRAIGEENDRPQHLSCESYSYKMRSYYKMVTEKSPLHFFIDMFNSFIFPIL